MEEGREDSEDVEIRVLRAGELSDHDRRDVFETFEASYCRANR